MRLLAPAGAVRWVWLAHDDERACDECAQIAALPNQRAVVWRVDEQGGWLLCPGHARRHADRDVRAVARAAAERHEQADALFALAGAR